MPGFPEIRLEGIAPEIALIVAAFVCLLTEAVFRKRLSGWVVPLLSTIGLGVAAFFSVQAWGTNELQLGRMVAVDGFAAFVKVTLVVFGTLTVWLGREYFRSRGIDESEFYALVLFAVTGMMLMASSADLIVTFIALETFSIALYVLVGFRRTDLKSGEGAMKYFLLGAFSSTFFLLGIALVYGAVGSTNLYGEGCAGLGIAQFLRCTTASEGSLLVLATGLLIVGLGFKIAAVPFHMWTPDAYQAASSPVTGFMAAATKLAGFAALLRLLAVGLFPLRWDWQPMIVGIAVITMVAGSVLAVVQDDVKRLLAYSSIAHAGFVLTGVVASNDRGISGSLFYLAAYGITVLGAFAVVSVLADREERNVRIADFRGLFDDHPLLAGALTLFLLSLAGVPLTSGFVGKLVVFGAAVEAGYWWLVVVGMIASAVAAFFYLRVMVAMYMQERAAAPVDGAHTHVALGIVGFAAVVTILLGLYWGPLIDVAEKATFFAGG